MRHFGSREAELTGYPLNGSYGGDVETEVIYVQSHQKSSQKLACWLDIRQCQLILRNVTHPLRFQAERRMKLSYLTLPRKDKRAPVPTNSANTLRTTKMLGIVHGCTADLPLTSTIETNQSTLATHQT